MQLVEFVKGDDLKKVNDYLKNGYHIEQIVPVSYPGFKGFHSDKEPCFGAYFYLQRQ